MFDWLPNPFRRVAAPVISLRAWAAGRTTRLNSGKWSDAKGTTVNDDLEAQKDTIRYRSTYEVQNNGIVEGVITTHLTDIVGPQGPTLEVQTENEAYKTKLEKLWAAWWAEPDIAGQLSGVDLLNGWIRSLWTAGEFFFQYVMEEQANLDERANINPKDPLAKLPLRISDIHPRRLKQPIDQVANDRIRLGVERDAMGRILAYHVDDEFANDPRVFLAQKTTRILSPDAVHGFLRQEAGQLRGVPWLACSLEPLSDVREYEAEVLDAARSAALFAAVLWTTDGALDKAVVNTSTTIKRREIMAAPPGYQVTQLTPQQPGTRYIEHVHELLRKVGRPVGMPLMLVLCDASKHNYSSARLDMQIYHRFTKCLQAWLERIVLNKVIAKLSAVARIAQMIGETPEDLKLVWHWQGIHHVDPTKEATAAVIRMETGQATLHEVLAEEGKDYDPHMATIKQEIEDFAAIGAVHPIQRETLKIMVDASAEDPPAKTAEDDNEPASKTKTPEPKPRSALAQAT